MQKNTNTTRQDDNKDPLSERDVQTYITDSDTQSNPSFFIQLVVLDCNRLLYAFDIRLKHSSACFFNISGEFKRLLIDDRNRRFENMYAFTTFISSQLEDPMNDNVYMLLMVYVVVVGFLINYVSTFKQSCLFCYHVLHQFAVDTFHDLFLYVHFWVVIFYKQLPTL